MTALSKTATCRCTLKPPTPGAACSLPPACDFTQLSINRDGRQWCKYDTSAAMTTPNSSLAGGLPEDPQETALLTGLRAGDGHAYERLVRTYGGRFLAVARRFLPNEEDARDALQDAFLSAFRAIGSFQEGARISTWLHRIVINAALMKLRTRRRRPEESIEDLLPTFLADGHRENPGPAWRETSETTLQRQEVRVLVHECISRLPDAYRTVLLLRDIEELDTEETAQLLDITPNAVKIRLHRARQALRTLLDPHFREEPT